MNSNVGSSQTSPQTIRLLVIEDCDTDRQLYERLLSKDPEHKYEFTYSASKSEALNLYGQNKFDCILLDYKLPGFTGLELLSDIANSNPEESPAAILLTGGGNEKLAAEAIKSGAKEYISKADLNPQMLQGAIQCGIQQANHINENRKKNSAIREALQAAKTASVAQGEFFAGLSHEFRTPLNGIIGFLELALSFAENNTQKEYLESASEAAAHLLELVNDILDLAKIESGKITLEKASFNLNSLINRSIAICTPQLLAKKIEIAFLVEEDVPKNVVGDSLRLKQVIVNLLGNAGKFTPEEGGIFLRVAVKERRHGSCSLLFSISDTGIGVSAPQRELIFKPYMQAESSTSRRFGGTGLGLSIASQLVKLMDGEIWVESIENIGSTFFFNILVHENSDFSRAGSNVANPERLASPKSVFNILVAEDDRVNQKLVRAILEREGHKVVVVKNGQEVLGLLGKRAFDLIVMDLEMPVQDGITTTLKIREYELAEGLNRMPIIALSGRTGDRDEEVTQKAGMDKLVTKPIDRKVFLGLVRELAGKH